MYVCTHACMCMTISYMDVYIWGCILADIHMLCYAYGCRYYPYMYVCRQTCMYAHIHITYMHPHIHLYVWICGYMYLGKHKWAYVCM